MGDLARHLKQTIDPGTASEDVAAWMAIMPLLDAQGLEAALLSCAPTPALEAKIAVAAASLIGEHERTVIAAVFSGSKKLRLTALAAQLLKPATGIPIITTNYDRLVEIAIEEAGIGVDTMFLGRFAGTLNERESRLSFCRNVKIKNQKASYEFKPRALICKPHGSLDWYFRDGKPVCYGGDLPGHPRLIITPGQNKFRNGYESPFDTHRNKGNDAIDRASRFLIIGYGFNDDHLETHLSPAIRNGKPTLMLTRELTAKAKALADGYANVIALDRQEQEGSVGTRLIIGKTSHFFPGLELWDVHSFVTGVLSP